MESKRVDKLVELYEKTSKHSNYQILPDDLKKYIPENRVHIKSRYEKERLDFIKANIDLKNCTFCDIGCNCGYFSLEFIKAGALKGDLYEGNTVHAEFVEEAANVLGIQNQLTIYNRYFEFDEPEEKMKYDVCLLLNVLHHIGDDYGRVKTVEEAKIQITNELKIMAMYTDKLVFQLGFNWMGDRNKGLFQNGTKEEMILWLEAEIKDTWEIEKIGVAEKNEDIIVYKELNSQNIMRMDSLGEFLNRPIFILKNKLNGR